MSELNEPIEEKDERLIKLIEDKDDVLKVSIVNKEYTFSKKIDMESKFKFIHLNSLQEADKIDNEALKAQVNYRIGNILVQKQYRTGDLNLIFEDETLNLIVGQFLINHLEIFPDVTELKKKYQHLN